MNRIGRKREREKNWVCCVFYSVGYLVVMSVCLSVPSSANVYFCAFMILLLLLSLSVMQWFSQRVMNS